MDIDKGKGNERMKGNERDFINKDNNQSFLNYKNSRKQEKRE